MKMDICNVHTTAGLLMGVDLVLRFLRQLLKALNHVHCGLLEHVPLGFLLWFLRVCSSFGLMRMVGKEPRPPSPQCNWLFCYLIITLCIR